jgi:hypothetical protein
MNTRQFLEGYVLSELPALTSRGRLIYHSSADHLLRGYWLETSAFTEGRFSVVAFVQVLAVPATGVTLSFGHRLGDGSDKWWVVGDGNEIGVAQDLVRHVHTEEATFFERIRGLSDFVAAYLTKNHETSDVRLAEALFYALVLLRRDEEAARIIADLALGSRSRGWEAQVVQRLSRDAADLQTDRSTLLKRIAEQEQRTRAALRLD